MNVRTRPCPARVFLFARTLAVARYNSIKVKENYRQSCSENPIQKELLSSFWVFSLCTTRVLALDGNFIICIERSIFFQNWKVRAVTPILEVSRIHCHENQTYHVKVPRLNFHLVVKTLSNSSYTLRTSAIFSAQKGQYCPFSAVSSG